MSEPRGIDAEPPPGDEGETLFALVRRRQREGWAGPQPERVEDLLAAFPALRGRTDEVVELIYQEMLQRDRRGQRQTLEEYLQRFPDLAGPLREMFLLHEASDETRSGSPWQGRSWVPLEPPATPTCPGHEILAEIGRGGMGVVYKARHLALGRLVALKVIRNGVGAGAEERQRFLLEAAAAARLSHPHIVRVYEVGEHQGQPYFSMEWVEGESLASKLAVASLPAPAAASLVRTLARAVHAAHQAGIVHRDLKPANVLLDAEGSPRVVDFGLAKQIDAEGLTGSGAVLGTPSYMAPEQAAGKNREVGPPADIYALGAILYECLTGRPPFKSESVVDTMVQVVTEDPVPPRRLNPRAPLDLENICLKCLQKAPEKRYPSALALADDLGRFVEGRPVEARAAGTLEKALKWARRRPVVAGLLALAATLAAAGAGSFTWAYRQALHQRDRAIEVEGQRQAEASRRQAEASRALAGSARRAARRGNWEGALRDYQAALDLGAEDEVGLRLGMLECRTALYQIPEFREKLAALARRDDLGRHAGTVLLMQAYDALSSGRGVAEAPVVVRKALEQGLPATEEAYARALLAPTVKGATGHLVEARRLEPAHRRALELLAGLLLLQGRLAEARDATVQLMAAAPNSLSGSVLQALLLAQGGEVKTALRLCDRLVGVYGKEGADFYRELVELTAEWTAEGFLWSEMNVKLVMEKWARWSRFTQRLSRLSKGAERGSSAAWNDFLLFRLPCVQALTADPALGALGSAGAAGVLASLTSPGKLPEALGRLAEGWPNGYFHWLRAVYLLRQKKDKDAEMAMLRALKTPSFVRLERRARFELVRTRWDRSRTLKGAARKNLQEKAREELRRFLALGGELPPWANLELGRLAREMGDEATALAAAGAFERQSAGKPRAAEPRFTTEFRMGAYGKAADTARGMLRAKPDDPVVANWVGLAELERRYYRAAMAAWLEALRIDPDNKTVKHNVVVLEKRLRGATALNLYLLERLRLKAALALARRGAHADAVKLARRLTAPGASGGALLALACVEALASDAARRDAALPLARRENLAERYARNAIDSLRKASEKGYFKDPTHRLIRNTEEDLAPVRGRSDFDRLSGKK
jgi:tetratricopeptide (TPR) repeat protein